MLVSEGPQIDKEMAETLARPLASALLDFFSDPGNAADFERWLQDREREVVC